MTKETFYFVSVLTLLCFEISAQTRYADVLFPDIRKRTFVYADTLKLDLYDAETDTLDSKALVLLVHGGGFVAGQRDGGEETGLSNDLAKKGYVVASMSYRLTMKGRSFGCDCPATTKIKTYAEAVEDVTKALYYLVSYATDFRIDPEQIILIGSSAGAETILNTIFQKDHYPFKEIPDLPGKVIGAVSLSGATLNRDYITRENAVPVLFFHGDRDDKVPFGVGAHHECTGDTPGYLMLDGPAEITKNLEALGVSFELFHDPEGGHEWADLGYRFPDLIADFLREIVLVKGEVFREEILSKPPTEGKQ